jgi:hypothetical protein
MASVTGTYAKAGTSRLATTPTAEGTKNIGKYGAAKSKSS